MQSNLNNKQRRFLYVAVGILNYAEAGFYIAASFQEFGTIDVLYLVLALFNSIVGSIFILNHSSFSRYFDKRNPNYLRIVLNLSICRIVLMLLAALLTSLFKIEYESAMFYIFGILGALLIYGTIFVQGFFLVAFVFSKASKTD